MRMGNSNYYNLIRFDGIDDAIGEFLNAVAPGIWTELSPGFRMLFYAFYCRIDFVSKGCSKAGPLTFEIFNSVPKVCSRWR